MAENLSPNEIAWRKFKRNAAAIPYEWTEVHRNAFDAGVRHGIEFVMHQIGWMLEERAEGSASPEGDAGG